MEERRFRAALADVGRWGLAFAAVLGVAGCAHKGPLFDIDTTRDRPAQAAGQPAAPTTAVLVQVVGQDGRAASSAGMYLSALNASTGLREFFEVAAGVAVRNVNGDGTLTDWKLSGVSIKCSKTQTAAATNYLCEEER